MEIEDVPITTQNQIIVQRLHESGFKPSEIMELEISGLKRTTVFEQCKMLKEGQKLRTKAGPGRALLLSDEDLLVIADYMNENPDACAPQVRKHVSETTGVEVGDDTIRRALKGLGLSYKESKNVSLLTAKAKADRLEWAKAFKERSFDKVVFTDESTFWLGKTGVARWKPTGDTNENMVPKNIPKLQVWGAISMNGKVTLKIFKENMDAKLYTKILEEKFSEVKDLFRSVSAWSWQQDNDPKHTSGLAKTWFKDKRIRLIDWPSYSPDLNPIENVWGHIKKQIARKRPRTLAELEQNLLELWNSLSKEYLMSLVASMPKRVRLIIANNGDRIPY
jgi:transposase